VQIRTNESVKRYFTAREGIAAENIYAPVGTRIEFRFSSTVHLLAMYEHGARREGETTIDGKLTSRIRHLANKLTFVPAGHAYHAWHEISAPVRLAFLYIKPSEVEPFTDPNSTYIPRVLFEDSVAWDTAAKLKTAVENGQSESKLYLRALAGALAHELSHRNRAWVPARSTSHGGLAGWQMRAIARYIETHLHEQISLVTLARIARLSESHFCRTFKHSFRFPPRQYQLQRRIYWAKSLLSDRCNSITDVGLALGYARASTFSVIFRKMTGQTPREFRKQSTSRAAADGTSWRY
jgi:AraC family transcriptional regulator